MSVAILAQASSLRSFVGSFAYTDSAASYSICNSAMPRVSVEFGGAHVHCTTGQLRGVLEQLGVMTLSQASTSCDDVDSAKDTPEHKLDLANEFLLTAQTIRLCVAGASSTPCSTLHRAVGFLKDHVGQDQAKLVKDLNILNHGVTALHHFDSAKLRSLTQQVQ